MSQAVPVICFLLVCRRTKMKLMMSGASLTC